MDEQPPQAPPADDMEPTRTPEQGHLQPPLQKQATAAAAFYGYAPFPPLMTLYTDFSELTAPLRTLRLCGSSGSGGGTTANNGKGKAADRDQLLYMVDIHYGYTPRGPLQFRPGLYLRNGTTTKAPILAAAGDAARLPLHSLISTFSLESVILLPPVDADEAKNPTRDLVSEVMRTSTTSTAAANGIMGNSSSSSSSSSKDSTRRLVTFHFAIEVGVKMRERVEFEWVDASRLEKRSSSSSSSSSRKNAQSAPAAASARDSEGSSSATSAGSPSPTKGHRFVLLRCPPSSASRPGLATSRSNKKRNESPPPSPSSSSNIKAAADDDWPDHGGQILAELVFSNVMSWNRLFSLELKGAGRTGELGDRWALMVVMTALRIYWLRAYGKTGKGVVRMGEKVRGI